MLKRVFDPSKAHRYVCYGRMSSDQQNPRSPDQQFATIEQIRQRAGYPWVLVRTYRDDGASGRRVQDRPGFQEMLRDIKTGHIQVDLILTDTFERFGRADKLAAIRQDLCNTYGVLILTADSNFADPTSVSGRALTFVEQIRSTEDGRVKAHCVLRGKRDLIIQKKAWPGGPPPFGFQLKSVMKQGINGDQEVDHKILVPRRDTIWIVQQIFTKAKETGYGPTLLSKLFNVDPAIPKEVKPLKPSTIAYILDNPIYYGELVWEKNSTDIVNDMRVMERNASEDMLRLPGFCQPIIPRELWDEVQAIRQLRREQVRRRRARKETDGKQIAPLAPGLTLKYLLTGIVRCGHCGASMRPSPSKKTLPTGKVWRAVYYLCPTHLDGSCSNSLYVRESWLREAVIGRLRGRLFPPPDHPGQVPQWLPPLIDEVRSELQRLAEERPDERLAWQREIDDLAERLNGWSLSLANRHLDPTLRADIEQQYGPVKARMTELQALLTEHAARQGGLAETLDPGHVLDRLQRLADVLAAGNATRGNLELSLHIDRIDCFNDGRVEMRTCKLGVFNDAVQVLRKPAEAMPQEAGLPGLRLNHQVKARRRTQLRIDDDTSGDDRQADLLRAIEPERFAGLEDRWFWQDVLELPATSGWAAANAIAVAKLRSAGWTVAALCRHFGKTPPTIRRALRLAVAADPSLKALPRKMPRRRWAADHAAEVAKLESDGLTVQEIARHLDKSDTTIRAALSLAAELAKAGQDTPDARTGSDAGDDVRDSKLRPGKEKPGS
jgi:DNA invertase Pin-like site-specific DNA recombinase